MIGGLQIHDIEGFVTPELHEALPTEQQSTRKRLTLASTPSGRYLARQTIQAYNELLDKHGSHPRNHLEEFPVEPIQHKDGEFIPRLHKPVDGNDVFLFVAPFDPSFVFRAGREVFESLESHGLLRDGVTLDDLIEGRGEELGPSPFEAVGMRLRQKLENANLKEAEIYIRTFAENNAEQITVVMPYHAYGRQNHATPFKREAILARHVADLLIASGAKGVITYDPHSDDIEGFYPFDVTKKMVSPFSSLCSIFEEYKDRKDAAFIFLDEGSAKRYSKLVAYLGIKEIYLSKIREGGASLKEISGELEGITVGLFADDIIGTGTTLRVGLIPLYNLGLEHTIGACSHPLLVGKAPAILMDLHENYGLEVIHVPDTVPQPERVLQLPVIKEYSVSSLQAKIINAIHYQQSASQFAHSPNEH